MGFIELRVFGGVVENLDGRVRRTRYLDMHHPLVVARHFQARQKKLGIVRCMDLQAVCRLRDFHIPTFSDTLKTIRLRKFYTCHTRTRRWAGRSSVVLGWITSGKEHEQSDHKESIDSAKENGKKRLHES